MPLLRDPDTGTIIEQGDLYALVLRADELGFKNVLFDDLPDPNFHPRDALEAAQSMQAEIKTLNKAPKRNADEIESLTAILGSLDSAQE